MKGYVLTGFSVILLISLFAFFLDETNIECDYSGIVHDIRSSSNGFTFYIDCSDVTFKCYSKEEPADLGYYGIIGSFSDDNTIFFIERMVKKGEDYQLI